MIRTTRTGSARATCDAPATPAGGAHQKWRGRGCGTVLGLAAGHAATASEQNVSLVVPSGQKIVLSDVLLDDDPGETWARFRFLAPQIGRNAGDIGYDVSAPDMDHLCESFALPYLAQNGVVAARVVISLSNQFIEFGASDPTVTQFFEAYRPEDVRCIWEEF